MTTAIKLSDIKIGDRVRYRVGSEQEGWGGWLSPCGHPNTSKSQ